MTTYEVLSLLAQFGLFQIATLTLLVTLVVYLNIRKLRLPPIINGGSLSCTYADKEVNTSLSVKEVTAPSPGQRLLLLVR